MDPQAILQRLLKLGRAQRFTEIAGVHGADAREVSLHLADVHLDALLRFFTGLPDDDRAALVKAIAVAEDASGGLGSVTALHRLLRLLDDPDRRVLDWVLRNTRSYGYYAHGARSVEEYDALCAQIAERAAKGQRRDLDRQTQDRARIAAKAAEDLYHAVRRGDLKAVQALLAKGADPSAPGPGGASPVDLARAKGRDDIVAELQKGKGGETPR